MSMKLGYLLGTLVFAMYLRSRPSSSRFARALSIRCSTGRRSWRRPLWARPLQILWIVLSASDIFGGTSLLFVLLMTSLLVWYRTMGSVSMADVDRPKAEAFYWLTIMFSQTLGTALGDWTADSAGLGYLGGARGLQRFAVGSSRAHIFWTTIVSRTVLFWTAFILTRPLGAVVGDYLDKPLTAGGLALSRFVASAVLLVVIVGCIVLFRQRPATRAH